MLLGLRTPSSQGSQFPGLPVPRTPSAQDAQCPGRPVFRTRSIQEPQHSGAPAFRTPSFQYSGLPVSSGAGITCSSVKPLIYFDRSVRNKPPWEARLRERLAQGIWSQINCPALLGYTETFITTCSFLDRAVGINQPLRSCSIAWRKANTHPIDISKTESATHQHSRDQTCLLLAFILDRTVEIKRE